MTTTQPSSPTASGHAMDAFFGALRRSPLTRSDNRWVGGVCSGIAERIGIPPVVVRIATLVVGFFTPILAIYLIAVLLLPNRRGQIRLERALRGCGGGHHGKPGGDARGVPDGGRTGGNCRLGIATWG